LARASAVFSAESALRGGWNRGVLSKFSEGAVIFTLAEMTTWLLLRCGPRSAAENMAVEEALLEAAGCIATPVLRFYSWSEPAASFGYFQRYAEVLQLTSLRPLVRRPTGGGLVTHDADWTYSLIFPPSAPW